jgi:hypothetical protein
MSRAVNSDKYDSCCQDSISNNCYLSLTCFVVPLDFIIMHGERWQTTRTRQAARFGRRNGSAVPFSQAEPGRASVRTQKGMVRQHELICGLFTSVPKAHRARRQIRTGGVVVMNQTGEVMVLGPTEVLPLS